MLQTLNPAVQGISEVPDQLAGRKCREEVGMHNMCV